MLCAMWFGIFNPLEIYASSLDVYNVVNWYIYVNFIYTLSYIRVMYKGNAKQFIKAINLIFLPTDKPATLLSFEYPWCCIY